MDQANVPSTAVEKHDERDSSISANVREEGPHDLGYYVAGQIDFVRGMGDRAAQVRNLFFQQSEQRGISGASYKLGVLSVDDQKRDYLFAERDLGKKAKTTIGVRIANIGSDLYIEWRHYVLPPTRLNVVMFGVLVGLSLIPASFIFATPAYILDFLFGQFGEILGMFVGLLLAVRFMIPAVKFCSRMAEEREQRLLGFQDQDAIAFRLAIRAAIEEAIDLAGIDKELRTTTKYEETTMDKQNRRIVI